MPKKSFIIIDLSFCHEKKFVSAGVISSFYLLSSFVYIYIHTNVKLHPKVKRIPSKGKNVFTVRTFYFFRKAEDFLKKVKRLRVFREEERLSL